MTSSRLAPGSQNHEELFPYQAYLASGDARTGRDASYHAPHIANMPRSADLVMLPSAAAKVTEEFIGNCPEIARLRQTADTIAALPVDILLVGETGSGKDQLARYIHHHSRRNGQFVAINCAGIPESLFESELFGCEAGAYTGATKARPGKLEAAHRGTLFLDEIESMPLPLQAKLLRVLQERQVERLGSNRAVDCEFRVIAATKVDLLRYAENGDFRLDLYYRLGIAVFNIPALRERLADIPVLFRRFVESAARRFGATPPPLDMKLEAQLLAHTWPGNVRELRACAERFVLGLPLLAESQPGRPPAKLRDAVLEYERTIITSALARSGGCVQRACEELDLPLQTLYYRLRRLGISADAAESGGSRKGAGASASNA